MRPVFRTAAVVLATALLASACSDASKSGEPLQGRKPSGDPIVIATIGNRVIGGSDVTTSFDGVEAWVAGVNDRGGIFGRPVEWVSCDGKEDPQKTIACAQKYASDPKVVALVGGISSLMATSVNPTASKADLLQILNGNSYSDQRMKDVLISGSGVLGQNVGLTKYVVGTGLKKVAVIRADIGITEDAAKGVKGAVEAAGGTYLGDVAVPLTATDYSSAVLQAVGDGAEVLATTLTVPGLIGVISAIKSNGLEDKVTVTTSPISLSDPNVQKQLGNVKVLAFADSRIREAGQAGHDEYVADLKLAGKVSVAGQARTASGWLAARLFEEVIKNAGKDFTRKSLIESAQNGVFKVPGFSGDVTVKGAPAQDATVTLNKIFITDGKGSIVAGPVAAY